MRCSRGCMESASTSPPPGADQRSAAPLGACAVAIAAIIALACGGGGSGAGPFPDAGSDTPSDLSTDPGADSIADTPDVRPNDLPEAQGDAVDLGDAHDPEVAADADGPPDALARLPAPERLAVVGNYAEQLAELDALTHHYISPVASPAAPGAPFALQATGRYEEGAPRISWHSREAGPGQSLVLWGDRMTTDDGSDIRLWLYTQTTAHNGALHELSVLRSTRESVTASVPDSVPQGLYLVWVENAAGVSRPVRLNAALAWWIGPDRAMRGAAVDLYGRRLDSPRVIGRIWNAEGTGPFTTWTVVGSNPFRANLQVPADAQPGRHEVWVHNGRGGEYGWSGPLWLEVESEPLVAWTGQVVTLAPVVGVDDTQRLNAAVRNAGDGGVVCLQPGSYSLRSRLLAAHSILLQRAGLGRCPASNGDGAATLVLEDVGSPYDGLVFRDFPAGMRGLTVDRRHSNPVDGGGVTASFAAEAGRAPRGVRVEDCTFLTQPEDRTRVLLFSGVHDVRVTDSHFVTGSGHAVRLEDVHQAFITRNEVVGTTPIPEDREVARLRVGGKSAVYVAAGSEIDVSDNVGRGADQPLGWLPRFFTITSAAMTSNVYVAHNQTRGTGTPVANAGEHILLENQGPPFAGTPTAVSETTLVFDAPDWEPDQYAQDSADDPQHYAQGRRASVVAIESGPGAGQMRRILTHTADTLTVDRPWDIAPDATSRMTVVGGPRRVAIYDNHLASRPEVWVDPDDDEHQNATLGIGIAGFADDIALVANDMDTMRIGVVHYGYPRPDGHFPHREVLVADNVMRNVQWGIATGVSGPGAVLDPVRAPINLGIVVRGNRVESPQFNGLQVGWFYLDPDACGARTDDVSYDQTAIIEDNEVLDPGRIGIRVNRFYETILLRRNAVVLSIQAEGAGVTGVRLHAQSPGTLSCDNTIDPRIETPWRCVVGMNPCSQPCAQPACLNP